MPTLEEKPKEAPKRGRPRKASVPTNHPSPEMFEALRLFKSMGMKGDAEVNFRDGFAEFEYDEHTRIRAKVPNVALECAVNGTNLLGMVEALSSRASYVYGEGKLTIRCEDGYTATVPAKDPLPMCRIAPQVDAQPGDLRNWQEFADVAYDRKADVYLTGGHVYARSADLWARVRFSAFDGAPLNFAISNDLTFFGVLKSTLAKYGNSDAGHFVWFFSNVAILTRLGAVGLALQFTGACEPNLDDHPPMVCLSATWFDAFHKCAKLLKPNDTVIFAESTVQAKNSELDVSIPTACPIVGNGRRFRVGAIKALTKKGIAKYAAFSPDLFHFTNHDSQFIGVIAPVIHETVDGEEIGEVVE